MLIRLNHLIIYCSDMQRSLAFYRDQLGFPVKMESPEWSEFHSGAVTLALHIAKPAPPASKDKARPHDEQMEAGQAHLVIEVADIAQFYQEKNQLGVEFVLPPTQQDFGKLAIFLDPDGLPISVTEEIR
ncbi:MAG: hypothetical protein A3H27_10225 [Acidobacteria bacterium RIFCSPLOWO2_02_FULL_59_13]|nr:MAG: hypothetical protein A3H27_10225 [Acidobacteria bacterium RIFCSPLOWO2_02_FULL_59_13]